MQIMFEIDRSDVEELRERLQEHPLNSADDTEETNQ
jgi:hypothetical protein